MYTLIQRSAQSILHKTSLPRTEADRIGSHIAARLAQADNFEKASRRYNTTDLLEIGEQAAKEYVRLILK